MTSPFVPEHGVVSGSPLNPNKPAARCTCDPGPEGQHRHWCDLRYGPEPEPVAVSDEAVEAAAKRFQQFILASPDWEKEDKKHLWLDCARAALEAARPHMGATPVASRERVAEVLNLWIREEIDRAIAFHSATKGNGHHPGQMCDGWSALTEAMQLMHDDAEELLALFGALPHLQPQVDGDAIDALLWEHRTSASNGTHTVCACDRTWRSDTEHRTHLRNALLALLSTEETK